ncbi:hypothetical protein ABNG30_20870 [Bacillus thuringiensis]
MIRLVINSPSDMGANDGAAVASEPVLLKVVRWIRSVGSLGPVKALLVVLLTVYPNGQWNVQNVATSLLSAFDALSYT